ncbi:hypothetical protein ABPG74_021644 [Tetrahymena malaccensis]
MEESDQESANSISLEQNIKEQFSLALTNFIYLKLQNLISIRLCKIEKDSMFFIASNLSKENLEIKLKLKSQFDDLLKGFLLDSQKHNKKNDEPKHHYIEEACQNNKNVDQLLLINKDVFSDAFFNQKIESYEVTPSQTLEELNDTADDLLEFERIYHFYDIKDNYQDVKILEVENGMKCMDIKQANEIGLQISKCKQLQALTLYLFRNQISIDEIQVLGSNLTKCQQIIKLSLDLRYFKQFLFYILLINQDFNKYRWNQLSSQGSQSLGMQIAQFTKLKDLNLLLQLNSIDSQGIKDLVENISKCSFLQNLKINLDENLIGEKGCFYLGQGLSKCLNLNQIALSLSGNLIGSQGALGLEQGLSKCQNIEEISMFLDGNSINSESASIFMNEISKCSNLTNIDVKLEQNQINSLGAQGLAKGISKFSKLDFLALNLSFSQINSDGATQIGNGIGKCQSLKHLQLELENNKIKQDEMILIIPKLKKSKRLTLIEIDI